MHVFARQDIIKLKIKNILLPVSKSMDCIISDSKCELDILLVFSRRDYLHIKKPTRR